MNRYIHIAQSRTILCQIINLLRAERRFREHKDHVYALAYSYINSICRYISFSVLMTFPLPHSGVAPREVDLPVSEASINGEA